MSARLRVLCLALGVAFATGASCGAGGGGGGGAPVIEVASPDRRCVAVPGTFPPGLDLVPGVAGRAVVASFTPPALIPFALGSEPPSVAAGGNVPAVPADSDGDGVADPVSPTLDGVTAVASDLALLSASLYDEVIFVDAGSGALRSALVSVDASIPAGTYTRLPAPGTSATRTAISSFACVVPPVGATDSRGVALAALFAPTPARCRPNATSFRTGFTSGVAVIGGHLFVSMSNVGDDSGTTNTQFLPGVVLVYDLDLSTTPPLAEPNASTGAIFTSAFNPTHVTAYRSSGGRDFVLVTNSGALGVVQDDPATPVIDAGGLPLTDASIDVIDVAALSLVATVPLGPALLSFDRLAIDPTGRVAVAGSAAGRRLHAIDLQPLGGLPALASGAAPFALDGSDARVSNVDARIFDAASPFALPARSGGAPAQTCPGFVVGAAFNAAGTRLYASDFCDGTLTAVGIDLSGSPAVPLPQARFRVLGQSNVVAPVGALGSARALGSVIVRSGAPGVDYTGPDVFVTVGEPEGLLCGLRMESL